MERKKQRKVGQTMLSHDPAGPNGCLFPARTSRGGSHLPGARKAEEGREGLKVGGQPGLVSA
jgi:hypothetical protein